MYIEPLSDRDVSLPPLAQSCALYFLLRAEGAIRNFSPVVTSEVGNFRKTPFRVFFSATFSVRDSSVPFLTPNLGLFFPLGIDKI